MKTNHFFWGIFLITIGLLFLIDNYIPMDFSVDFFINLWPIIFIVIGLRLLIKNKAIITVITFISSILLALIVYAFILNPFTCGNVKIYRDAEKEKIESISHTYSPIIKSAKLNVDFSFGNININKCQDRLIDGEVRYKIHEYKFDGDLMDTSAIFSLTHEKPKSYSIVLPSKRITNKLLLNLHTNPLWDLKINSNFSKFDFLLTQIKANKINLESSFSTGKLKLGMPQDVSTIDLTLNFSTMTVILPDTVGVEVRTDKNFSTIDLEDFDKVEKNLYRSKNFDKTKNHYVISVSSNFSSISFKQ